MNDSSTPYLKLKIDINEAFVGRVVSRLGGRAFDGAQQFPTGVKPVDFLVEGYALEFKAIEKDPLEDPERPERISAFIDEKIRSGALKSEAKVVHLQGALAQEYWRGILGVSVGRHVEKAQRQIISTREYLNSPSMPSAVFVVNQFAPTIDPESFVQLVSAQQKRFKDVIDLAFAFSGIPALAPGHEKPCVLFECFPYNLDTRHQAFADSFHKAFRDELTNALGKSNLEELSTAQKVSPVRVPIVRDTKLGKMRFH